MKKVLIPGVLAFLFILPGCVTSSGVVPFGKDTYMIEANGHWAAPSERPLINAVKEATAYCTSIGKEFEPDQTMVQAARGLQPASGQLIFRCLSKDDPQYQRTEMRPAPNVIIENRK